MKSVDFTLLPLNLVMDQGDSTLSYFNSFLYLNKKYFCNKLYYR